MAINNTSSQQPIAGLQFGITPATSLKTPKPAFTINPPKLNLAGLSPTPDNSQTPNAGPVKGLVSPQATPSTALKSHTTTDTAGNTTTQTFHAPVDTANVQKQLDTANKELNTVKAFGYGPNDNIQKDAQGNIIGNPANQPQPQNNSQGLVALANKQNQDLTNSLQSNFQNQNLDTAAMSAKEAAIKAVQGTQLQNTISLLGSPSVAPQLGAFGQTYYNPNQPSQGGNGGALNPLNNVDSIADQILSGQISPAQGYALGGNVSNFQGVLNQAIQKKNPKTNLAQLQGSYDAHQSNTTTAGTTPTNAAASAYQKTYGDYLDLKNTTQNVDQFGNLLLSTMKDTSGNTINPFDVKYANTKLADIRSQLSSEQQATFDSTYASLKARVASLLATGGAEIPTQITSDANKVLDGSLPLSALSAVLSRIGTEGRILTSNLENKLNTAGGIIGASKTGQSNNPLGI